MEHSDNQIFEKEWDPKEIQITENTTKELFQLTGKKRCCDETQKQVIALLEKGNRPFEVLAELRKIGKDMSLDEITTLQRKKQQMHRNNNVDQTPWEESLDNHRKRELIKRIFTARAKNGENRNLHGNAQVKKTGTTTNEIGKIIANQSLN